MFNINKCVYILSLYVYLHIVYALQFCLYHCLGTLSDFKHFRKSPVQVLLTSHTRKEAVGAAGLSKRGSSFSAYIIKM